MKRRPKPVFDDPGCEGTDLQLREDAALVKQGYFFDKPEADRVCTFFETCVYHHKGKWAGTTIKLEPWERRHIRRLMGWRQPSGVRRYTKTFWILARKNGKSLIASGLALYLTTADGEKGAEVYALGANKEQAKIVFGEAKKTALASKVLNSRCTAFSDSIFCAHLGSKFMPLSGTPGGKHGFNPHGIVVDELHEFKHREAFDAITTGSGAREQPLTIIITTAGDDELSLCFEEYDYACKVRDGIFEDPHFLPVIYEASKDDDWEDEKTWIKANPNIGVSVTMDFLRKEYQEAIKKPGRQPAFKRFYLNLWVNMTERWLDMAAWNRCGKCGTSTEKLMERFAGRMCYGGLDLSKTTDLTALVLVFPEDDGGYSLVPFFWCPEETIDKRSKEDRAPYRRWAQDGWLMPTPGNVVDYNYIRTSVAAIAKEVELRELAFDRKYATMLVQQLQDDHGITLAEFGQGFGDMPMPTAELERQVVGRKLRHYGNPILRWMASNAVVTTNAAGDMKPVKPNAKARIDGIVATIMGIGRAMLNENGPSVYEGRGIVSL